jgi:cytochrome c-type biogenesis protein CcmH/NrfG
MKSDAIAFGVAGILFGLIAGWIIGTQQAKTAAPAAPSTQQGNATTAPPALDETQVTAFKTMAERESSNPVPRVQLGNLYMNAERFDEAIKWYSDALKLAPKDVNVITNLGESYYYSNQPDRALEQFNRSLALEPKHLKAILYVGIVKAWGKQDLEGAQVAWQQVIQIAPDSPEGQQAKDFLERLRASHPTTPAGQPSGS